MAAISNSLAFTDRRPLATPVGGVCPVCAAKVVGGALKCGCKVGGRLARPLGAIGGHKLLPSKIPDRSLPQNLEFSDHFSTKEKQEYYCYNSRPYRMKTPPKLGANLAQALKRERLDKTYRFVWAGVVIVREEPNSDFFTIARGDRNATHVVNKVVLPKYPWARATQARGFFYYNDLSQKICTQREEFVPKDRVARVDYRYVDFGILKWMLEQRIDGAELVKARVYDAKEDVPESQWICVMPLETTNGLYYEPGVEMIEVLQKREWENRNRNLKEVAREEMQRMAKAQLASEEADDEAGSNQFNQVFDDVMRRHEKQVSYSLPTMAVSDLSNLTAPLDPNFIHTKP